MHAALRRRFLVLLDCHHALLVVNSVLHGIVGMARRERQRQHQFVLDQRQRIERLRRQDDFRVASGIEVGELALVACARSSSVRCVDRPREIAEASLARQGQRALRARSPARGDPSHRSMPAMRQATDAGPSASRSSSRGSRCGSTRPSMTPRSRARRNASSLPRGSSLRARHRRRCRTPGIPRGRRPGKKRRIIPLPRRLCQKMSEKTMENAERPLVLASTSRYRRALLERLGWPFEAVAPEVDEAPLPGESPAARRAARRGKGTLGRVTLRKRLVIGSDQVADAGGIAISKPGDPVTAAAQLRAFVRPHHRVPHGGRPGRRRQPPMSACGWSTSPARFANSRRLGSQTICAAKRRTTAPGRSSPRASASRCSSGSLATIPRPSSACR